MSQCTLFTGGTLYTVSGPLANAWLMVTDAKIGAIGAGAPPACADAQIIPMAGRALVPGLIDMHVHGALGRDAMEPDPEALRQMASFYAQHGVTSFLASTITASREATLAALEAIKTARENGTTGALVLGAHLEGPYIDAARRGAHDLAQVRLAAAEEYMSFLESGVIRLLTVAPDYPENLPLIKSAVLRGITVALGHSRASYDQVCQAIVLGARQVTHLFNGMEPLHHRQPGLVGAALTQPALVCELIADLVHLSAPILQLALKAKGINGLVLVTDAMAGTGMPDGEYLLGDGPVTVLHGEARTPGGALAGSTLTLEHGLFNMMNSCQLTLAEALPLVTANPARQLGLSAKGSIRVGSDADLAMLDSEKVVLTMVGGRIVYSVL